MNGSNVTKKKTKKDEKIYDRTCTKFKCLPT